jgi:hypothetical protein
MERPGWVVRAIHKRNHAAWVRFHKEEQGEEATTKRKVQREGESHEVEVEKEKNHRENTEARLHREEEEGRRKQAPEAESDTSQMYL